jgi:YD repeat-containing protein
MHPVRLALSHFVLLALLSATPTYCQTPNPDNTTTPPIPGVGHDYIKMFGETVNPANGSVSLRISLPTPKGRGMDVPFAILYSSTGVEHVVGNPNGGGGAGWGTDNGQATGSGWSLSVPTLTFVQGINQVVLQGPPPSTQTCYYYYSYVVRDWYGAAHPLGSMVASQAPFAGNDNCQNPTNSILTGTDGVFQGITTAPANPYSPNPVTAVDPDGSVYSFSNNYVYTSAGNVTSYLATLFGMEDRNGNSVGSSIRPGTNGVLSGSLSDDLNRAAVSVSPLVSNSNTISISGQSGNFTQAWTSVPYSFSVRSTYRSPFCGTAISPAQGSNYVLQTLTLPNGQTYQFQYDSKYGLLKKITYPNGAYVSYTWGLNLQSEITMVPIPQGFGGGNCPTVYDYPAITQRTVSFDGVNIAEQQTFTYQTTWSANGGGWSSKQTTVTTNDLVRGNSYTTTYTYIPRLASPYGWFASVPVEQSIVYKDFSGAVLKTVTKAWIDKQLLGCELEQLDTGVISGRWYSYSSGDQLTDKKEYD